MAAVRLVAIVLPFGKGDLYLEAIYHKLVDCHGIMSR